VGHFVEIPDRFENHSLRSERSAMAGEVTAPGEIFGAVTDAFRKFGAVTAPLAINFAVTAPRAISPFLTTILLGAALAVPTTAITIAISPRT
jgi:hypothetical protein